MLQFPVATMIRFCHNHGLIQVTDRPQWFSVVGGARNYVEKILAGVHDKRLNTPVRLIERDAMGVRIVTDGHAERFDQVVIATHTDQALRLLREPSAEERSLLGAIRYQDNHAVLHTDARVLPSNSKTWAAWNYERAANSERESARVCLHYLLNRLQRIPFQQPVVVSLNPVQAIDPATIVGEYAYAHPVFDLAAIEAQKRLPLIQGQQRTWSRRRWLRLTPLSSHGRRPRCRGA
jgi:predicted NAD/FAD-binding protein